MLTKSVASITKSLTTMITALEVHAENQRQKIQDLNAKIRKVEDKKAVAMAEVTAADKAAQKIKALVD